MASFFWIGSAANWATNNWSSTSGGVSNGSQPTSADDVIFDQNSPGNCTVTVSTACRSLDFRGGNPDGTHDFTHTLTVNSAIILTLGTSTSNGTLSLRLSPSMTLTFASQTSGGFTFASTSGTVEQITTNGKSMATTVFNGAGGSWQLQDNFSAAGAATTTMTLTAGTLDLNGKYVTLGKFASSNSNTRTLSFNGATVELQAISGTAWNMATVTGLTLNAASGLIYMNGAQGANCTFASGSKVYGNLTVAHNNIGPTFTGSPTFAVVTVAGPNMTFTAGTTMTWGSLVNVGSGGGIVFASTASGSTYTLKCAAGISLPAGAVANQISDCIASGGIPFYAGHGAVLTNTTGWVAADPPVFPTRRPAHRIALRLCRPRPAIAPAAQAPPPPQPAARAQRVAQPRSRAARALPHQAPTPIAGKPRRVLLPRARKTPAPALPSQQTFTHPGTRSKPRISWTPTRRSRWPLPHQAPAPPAPRVSRVNLTQLSPSRRTIAFPLPGTVTSTPGTFGPGTTTPTGQLRTTRPAERTATTTTGALRLAITLPAQHTSLSSPTTGTSQGAPAGNDAHTSPAGRAARSSPKPTSTGATSPRQRTALTRPTESD